MAAVLGCWRQAAKAPAQFPARKARLDGLHARGELLMVGTFGNPQEEGSMAIFRSRPESAVTCLAAFGLGRAVARATRHRPRAFEAKLRREIDARRQGK